MLGFPGGGASPAPAPPPATEEERRALLEPPAGLPASIDVPGLGPISSPQDFWREWAPHAIAQRTLVPATAAGFGQLCEVASFQAELAARLRKFGSQGKEGDARMKNYDRLSKRVEAGLHRFKLTAFAKPADAGGPRKPAANPFSQVV